MPNWHMKQSTFEFSEDRIRPALAYGEEPQARLEHYGAQAVSDTELLAVLLQGGGIGPARAVELAGRVIADAGSMGGLAGWTAADYSRWKGIGRTKASQLGTLAEIGRRMMTSRATLPLLDRAQHIVTQVGPAATGLAVEKFWVLCLNRKNRLMKQVEVTSGTATAALAHPREVFRAAIRESAAAIACVHNHPSGDPAPSAPDLAVTRQLREAARAVEIDLIDHVIIGRPEMDPLGRGYFSFREAGML